MADALFTQTQQRVLGALFGQPHRAFGVAELIAVIGAGSGAVQRELAKLAAAGLVSVTPLGNQKRYQANAAAPIHDELVAIVQKTVGLAGPLGEALSPVQDQITVAFVYGSVAKGSDTAHSDIDLMILSDTLGYAEVMQALDVVQVRLGRPVNPTLYSKAEFTTRIHDENSFLMRVLEQPKIWIIGGHDDLSAAPPVGTG
ncbi:nucleotidyltransferase domain-containing protein [Stenotrophomonas sp.]|uniref:nucleotidyltransferase domain-containing protein n=1 Tax=Stenotrophomonas sp. TaxID=69392 RepID=UPI002FC65795